MQDFRQLPAVHRILNDPILGAQTAAYPHEVVVDHIRRVLAAARQCLQEGGPATAPEGLVAQVVESLQRLQQGSLRRVINGTGIVLNTNLGRAPLAPAALEAIRSIGSGYSNLEYDLEAGERGSRHDHVNALLQTLTGAEAALVVNNNAAAVLLVASCFAAGKEIIVSRGQLIEIGGSFRLPDVIAMSGARLVEVGTTNKTYARDYVKALSPETGLLLRCHPSNFRIEGFTAEVSAAELAAIGREHGIVTCEDLGSGQLLDLTPFGLPAEPTVGESVGAGLDLITMSGDKLLGGPQAGLIVGKGAAIAELRRHPLLRALRPDKLTLAALHATLQLYLQPPRLAELPAYRMLTRPLDAVKAVADDLAEALQTACGDDLTVAVEPGDSPVGGGSLPGATLPTQLVVVRWPAGAIEHFARRLRLGAPALVGRIRDNAWLLDPRTLLEGEAAEVPTLIRRALALVND